MVRDFLNLKALTLDGFTPLHFACMNGSHEFIEYLLMKGANMYSMSETGINMLHIAAQADKPYPIAYFKDLGINSRDH